MPRPGPAPGALAKALSRLKVFPLQGVVAFPRAPTPFHIFEPRYRDLTSDALAGDKILAVATIADGEEAPLMSEAVRPIACACVIEDHERLGDGRFHILVRGLARVRLLREVPSSKLYRMFRAETVDDVLPAAGPESLTDKSQALEQVLIEIAQGLPAESGAPQLAEQGARLNSPSALADLAAAALVTDGDARYAVLAEPDVSRRLDLVTGEAAAVLLAITSRASGGAKA
jgi:Lon protease-like protein